ncbi:prenyltransferase, UbiA family [Hyphomonas neptunium ATCC 15444]|uniref:Prenyltransferase, UbiA family n=2 Tax=Hyphomonas TaxID=85 RepID=Q0C0H5_HYPNA|nr:UbiA family prenyltransferase [Hyphomonas neptunium]ABI76854.1 prenyltransferase, UbiA family [Hyphomonas neptunium ATCC 15444]
MAQPVGAQGGTVPLVLDLDGTLIRTDSLQEQALAFVRRNPFAIFKLIGWVLAGRVALKEQLANAVQLDPEHLPVNEAVVALAQREAATGRKVVLATAAHAETAKAFLQRFPFISEMLATDGKTNLKGKAKAEALAQRFPEGFDYAGDSSADVEVWKRARNAITVGASSGTVRKAKKVSNVIEVIPRTPVLKAFIKCLRPHQWAKNALVVVPAILSGLIIDPANLLPLALAFFALSLTASATYVFNDIWDLQDDRQHWSKRRRPFASGTLSLPAGIAGALVCFIAGLILALLAGPAVLQWVLIYVVVTLTYSLWLKRKVIHDALTLASLFTLRLVVGMVAVAAEPSPWLFVFAMFFFTSLAFAKRHTEIARVIEKGGFWVNGRGYRASDLPLVLAAGISSSVAAVIIMVLYIIEDAHQQSFIKNGDWLWALPPLIFLISSRIWVICQRGELDDDPVVFVVKDKICLAYAAMTGISFFLAWFGVPL